MTLAQKIEALEEAFNALSQLVRKQNEFLESLGLKLDVLEEEIKDIQYTVNEINRTMF